MTLAACVAGLANLPILLLQPSGDGGMNNLDTLFSKPALKLCNTATFTAQGEKFTFVLV
jgi:hypothetical protein